MVELLTSRALCAGYWGAKIGSGMWKGSVIAVALILVSAVCAFGCSSEICDLPAAPQGSCHPHSQSAPHPAGHECFHKAATPEQASSPAPVLDATFMARTVVVVSCDVQIIDASIPAILTSPPLEPPLTLRV
jgi:hypothetical protein